MTEVEAAVWKVVVLVLFIVLLINMHYISDQRLDSAESYWSHKVPEGEQ